jgi:hypothetical protein
MTDILGHCSCWLTYGVYFTEELGVLSEQLNNLYIATPFVSTFIMSLPARSYVAPLCRRGYREWWASSTEQIRYKVQTWVVIVFLFLQHYSSIKTTEVLFDGKQKQIIFWIVSQAEAFLLQLHLKITVFWDVVLYVWCIDRTAFFHLQEK